MAFLRAMVDCQPAAKQLVQQALPRVLALSRLNYADAALG